MPAKSKDATAAFFHNAGTLAVPRGLPKGAAELWRQIMKSTPAGQFREGDVPILSTYCRVSVLASEALDHLEREQVDPLGKPSPWVRIASDHAKTLATLGSRLRLAPSSRIRAESHSLRQRPAFTGSHWDDSDGLLAPPIDRLIGRDDID